MCDIMVEFCPKCGSLLIPTKRKGGKVFLVCRRCKFEKQYEQSSSYKGVQLIDENKKIKTSVIEKPIEVSKEKKVREIELLQEAYYEVFLETMAEQEVEGGSED